MGISSISNSIVAKQHWTESHYMRTLIIYKNIDKLGMANKEDISKD